MRIRRGRRSALGGTLALLILAISGWLSSAPASAVTCTGTDWSADYFAGTTPGPTPVLSRCDPAINFNWGQGSPGLAVPADQFSARWTRTIAFAAGTYVFTATGDDGIRVKLDGTTVLDGWKDQSATTYNATVTIAAGSHVVAVEYYDNTYDAVAQFSYSATGATSNLVGNGSLTTGSGFPSCFVDGSWGASTRSGAFSSDLPAGSTGRSWVETVSAYSSGDAKIMPSSATGCAPIVSTAKSYKLAISYKSTVATNAIVAFTQNASGGWDYWTTLASLPASAAWSQQSLTVPQLPTGTTRLSFGMAAIGAGVLSTTGYGLAETTAPPPPPPGKGLDATGQWTVSSLSLPDRSIHSTLLRDGRVLLVAGSGNDSENFAASTFTTKVWNPTTGAVTDVPTPYDMFCSGHVTLADGRILILGGTLGFPGVNGVTTFLGSKHSYVFDPTTNTYTPLNDLNEGHWYPTPTKLGNGDVWAAGGLSDNNPNGGVANTTELFSYSQNRWLATSEIAQSWQYWGEYPAMFLLQDGRLFYTGGHTFGDQRAGSGASVYNVQTASTGDILGLTDKDLRDHSGSVLVPPAQNQTFLIAGGGHIDAGSAPTNSTAVINMNAANPSYIAAPPLPGPGRQYVNLTNLFDRTVLASNGATGNRTGNIFAASIYHPATNSWDDFIPADPVGRNYHSTALLLPDGRVLVMGSNPIDGSFESRVSVYSPPYVFRGTRPTVTGVPTTSTYGSTFPIGVTGTVVSASLTSPGSDTHQMDSNARLVDLPLTGTGATRTATVPTNRNLLPPGPYMITVLDSTGVPSVAAWVTVR